VYTGNDELQIIEHTRVGHGSLLNDPIRPIVTVRHTDLYPYLLITFASVTDCLKINTLFMNV